MVDYWTRNAIFGATLRSYLALKGVLVLFEMYTVFHIVSIVGITGFGCENSLFLYRETTHPNRVCDNRKKIPLK
jgi:hypothetical protein